MRPSNFYLCVVTWFAQKLLLGWPSIPLISVLQEVKSWH